MNPAPKPATFRDPGYLEWLRSLPCLACHRVHQVQRTPTQAAHMRTKRNHGDKTALPMCAEHHAEQHSLGIRSFLKRYGIRLTLVCHEYRSQYEVQHFLHQNFP